MNWLLVCFLHWWRLSIITIKAVLWMVEFWLKVYFRLHWWQLQLFMRMVKSCVNLKYPLTSWSSPHQNSSLRTAVKGRSWSWLSLSSHFLVGGGWVWSGDKLHYPGCAKYRLHGGSVRALQRLLPGWNLEHFHRHPQKKCPKPANVHWGGPHPAGAPKMELSGWCYCR